MVINPELAGKFDSVLLQFIVYLNLLCLLFLLVVLVVPALLLVQFLQYSLVVHAEWNTYVVT